MLLLVNNLMDIQKYEAGKTILQKTSFNFSAFIREMYHSFESVAGNREIRFTLDNELPETYQVCFDEAEIERYSSICSPMPSNSHLQKDR